MASDDLVAIRVRMTGVAETVRDERAVRSGMEGIGTGARKAGLQAREMGGAVEAAMGRAHRSIRNLSYALPGGLGGTGLIGAALYGVGGFVKQGLAANAQIESAQLRFRNFTNDAQGLYNQVQLINHASRFDLSNLANAAALLGNMGVRARDVPKVLKGIANAAAASGGGDDALNRIALAIGQIQSKGRLSQEELNQLTEAGAPNVQQTIARGFHLTSKEVQNIGNNALNSRQAIRLLTREWTSGKLAEAAKRDAGSLAGQWALLHDNVQEVSQVATKGLSGSLEHDVLPAANRAASAIRDVFGRKGLSDEEKLRQARDIIRTDLGPTWEGIKADIDRANIPQHLGEVVAAALPYMAANAASIAPQTAKAFVNAFLHSGPWGMLITTLFIGSKTGALGKIAGAVLGGRRGGGLGGVASRATPIPVWVVNNGPMPGGGPGRLGTAARRIAPFAATAGRLAIDAGPVALALGIPIAAALEEGGRVGGKPTQPRGRTAGQVVQGHDTYLGPMRRSMATPTGPLPAVVVSDRQTQQALANLNAHQRARR